MDEAIAHYQKVLELRPENADAHANLGSVFLAKGRVRDAIAQYRDALRITPDNVARPEQSGMAAGDSCRSARSEMGPRLFSSLNGQNPRALGAKITQLFYAFLLRHTLRLAVLLTLRKLLKRLCKRQRWRVTPHYPALSGAKSRCTSSGCRIISRRDDLMCPNSVSRTAQCCELIPRRCSSKGNLPAIEQSVFFEKIR